MNDSTQINIIIEQWRHARPDVNTGPMAVIGKLRRLSTRLQEHLVRGYADFELGEGEFDVLSSLRRMGAPYELPVGQLAEHTMVTAGATSKRVGRLVEAGLVTRRNGPEDHRGRIIALTQEGVKRIDAAFERHAGNEQRLAEGMTEDELHLLDQLASKWLDTLPEV